MATHIAAVVRSEIIEGRRPPGEPLLQERLAEEFGASRNPCRQAIQQLASEGLVVLKPHSTARVAEVHLERCIQLYQIRELLEGLVVSGVNTTEFRERESDIRRAMIAVEAAVDDPVGWIQADREFHLNVAACSAMGEAKDIAQRLFDQTQQYRNLYMQPSRRARMEIAHMEHRLMVETLAQGDLGTAASLARNHVRRTRISLEVALREEMEGNDD